MEKFSLDKFKNISKTDISPIYSWVWNSPVSRELIKTQLDEMKKQGIRKTYILPEPKEFRPDSMVTTMSPDYLSDEFFELVKYAVEYGKSIGISMWLYDEGGWPSGSACGKVAEKYPDSRAKRIGEKEVFLNKGEKLSEENIISAFDENFNRIDELSFVAEEDCKVYIYFVEELNTYVPYLLDKRAVDEFIELTYEGYKKHLGVAFGKNPDAIFTDEPMLDYPFYIADTSEFEKQSGLSFKDNLPALFHIGFNDRFRAEYIDYCSKVFEKQYLERLEKWCSDNNISFTGHMDGDHHLIGFTRQGGNALRHLRHMHIPGVDSILRQIFPGNKDNNFFPRFASSAANQTGKKYAVSETFSVYGNGVTFEQMRYVINYQFIRGINIINIMSIPTGREEGLSLQCRPHFVPELPTFEFMAKFNDYLSRISYLCQLGEVDSATALYMPMRAVWAGKEECEDLFWKTGRKLEENQVYFDIIDDDYIISNSDNLKYEKICVPTDECISDKARDILNKNRERIYENPDDIMGYVKADNPWIRAMKRKLQGETLYLLFNESEKYQEAEIEFCENGNYYLLDCISGEINEVSETKFCFESGEMLAVLFTDKNYECIKNTKNEKIGEIENFSALPIRRLLCKDGKIYNTDEDMVIDSDFSGKVCYSAELECDENCDLLLKFDYINECATVVVNGEEIDKIVMPPYRIKVRKELLKKSNRIEIFVSNTSANALVNGDYQNISKEKLGPYHERTLVFEKECRQIGIGKMRMYKIKEEI